VATNASWLNQFEAQFEALRRFALNSSDRRPYEEQNSVIRRHVAWPN